MRSSSSRRKFLKSLGVGASAAMLANAGMPLAVAQDRRAFLETVAKARLESEFLQPPNVELLIGDVVAFQLVNDDPRAPFGSVTLMMHKALFEGEACYYIRTDASDQAYAETNKVVFVPLLNAALTAEGGTSPIYAFTNGVQDQLPVVTTVPGMPDYSPARHAHRVTFNGEPELLTSAADIQAAEAEELITIEETSLVINLPAIQWPGGQLQRDTERRRYIGTGPLLAPVDTRNMRCTFKLHQCYPGARYFFTDSSMEPMATAMRIAASPPTQALMDVGATDEIWVFGNGIPGPGPMGFQPSIFDNEPGSPVWSPFWNHFTVVWNDPDEATVVKSGDEVRSLIEAGNLQLFNGVPDSHPTGFVVNCPVPIKATNTFEPA